MFSLTTYTVYKTNHKHCVLVLSVFYTVFKYISGDPVFLILSLTVSDTFLLVCNMFNQYLLSTHILCMS